MCDFRSLVVPPNHIDGSLRASTCVSRQEDGWWLALTQNSGGTSAWVWGEDDQDVTGSLASFLKCLVVPA